MSDALMHTYAPLPVTFDKGDGCWLWDTEGKRYLDALGGIAVCGLGHAHPAVTEAICQQAGQLIHTSNLYHIAHQQALADKLTALAGMERVFFSNSGAEANEAAIKLARLHGHSRGIEKPTVIVMEGSFHGRTLATLSATGNRKVQAGFEPLVSGFLRVPYNDLDAIAAVAKNNQNVVAVLVEPIQGEGGIRIPDDNYLPGIRALCNDNNWLMMLDEIQTGMGRSGQWFAHQQQSDATPDVMTLAKALGNGMPIGACLARGAAAHTFQPGNHGSTYGGNPLVCRVALSVIDTIEKEKLCERAASLGTRLLTAFGEQLADVEGVNEIRGKGLLLAIELDRPCAELVKIALAEGLLINVTANNVVRLLPPLIMTDDEATQLVEQLSTLIRDFLSR
ncbi:MAG: aspartate aminotransferase family protein [Gammaproteobacteria bacterium]|nr:aspartate aminotransferase family protein [Gammaproteobacteria bacterium]MCF6260129.1 aspartate aminotransferase family protein [Gammaproteobacteria bacterium]